VLDSLTLAESQRVFLERATAAYERDVDALGPFLVGRGITREAAVSARLGRVSEPEPGHERFAGMMSIPYVLPSGVVAMKFRRLDDGTPKYDGPSGQGARLYNAGVIASTHSNIIAICEGELDALVCTSVVGVPGVGRPGGGTWLDHWSRCFADFERVLIVADNDDKEDGSNPGLKSAKAVQKRVPNSQIVLPPLGMDLGEWVLHDGADAVRKAMGL
jgi:hypothetical protein